MNIVADRLEMLRAKMKEISCDFFFCTSDDFHGSEYVADYFKVREHYTGFTGENAFLLVSAENAYMWTDGRFFIQAEKELSGTGVTLMKMGEPGVPSIGDFIKEQVGKGQSLFFDGRMVSNSLGKKIEKIVTDKGGTVVFDNDFAGELWNDRPLMPSSKLLILNKDITGESIEEKIKRIREKMNEYKADYHFISSLDDIAWITNMRGSDIECNPVFLSYMLISSSDVILFMENEEVSEEVKQYLFGYNVKIEDYNNILKYLSDCSFTGKILLDESGVNYSCVKILENKAEIINKMNPAKAFKSVKNETEIKHLKEAYLQDSVAVIKFIYWLKNTIGKEELTEIKASDYLDDLRRKIPGFLDLSFPTISGYASNGAIVHYSATKESNATLKAENFLLVDSGGQYVNGTTDVTRTIALGPLTDEMKLLYTKTAVGMLSLGKAKFLYGCTGRNLDILSRKPLWDLNIDFKHGTGHGVGYILNVHEGPQNIRWKFIEGMTEYPFEAGMITSDEPGVYLEGKFGVRIENVILCIPVCENEFGKFLGFEHLTFAPLEREALDIKNLNSQEIELINEYQAMVYDKTNKYLTKEEAEWLYTITRPL